TGDYGGRAFVEGHLALDTLLALRYGAAPPDCADQTLTAACDRLQTRRNMFQPYEDWGVMCCWPSYSLRADLFAKSAQSYHYHNGASWPYLNAMYAELLLERGDPDWRYVLARWWKVQLKNGWLTPAEYFSPAHPVGGLLQGWSGMGLSAMLTGGLGLRPALDGTLSPRTPPWGDCVLRHLTIHGEPKTVTVKNDRLKIT
ncbi:MAG: hypothetical protein JW966_03380, partial [Anaerolineae bacterium]|nr:hypothetical protein [Anaerolineae bacterium]